MRIEDFKLEHFFERWEFSAPLLLCCSDIEGWRLTDLVALADAETRGLWDDLRLGYTESPGHPLLRAEIGHLYENLRAEEVLVFAGAQEPIFAFMNAVLEPGDHVVAITPCYQSLSAVPRAIGADVTSVPLDHDSGWSLDVGRVRSAFRPRTRVLAINVPNSPTGALLDRAAFMELHAFAESRGAYVFADEVYRGLEHGGAERLPASADVSQRGVSLGVMSKAFGLAGLRIGWLATRDAELLRRLASFKHYTTICSSAPSEILALMALRSRQTLLARAREIVARNLVQMDRFFEEWSGVFEWVRPRGGTTAFPRLLADVPIEAFAAELVEKEGVLLMPGSIFDYAGNHFRLGLGRVNLPEALARLEAFTEQRLGKPALR